VKTETPKAERRKTYSKKGVERFGGEREGYARGKGIMKKGAGWFGGCWAVNIIISSKRGEVCTENVTDYWKRGERKGPSWRKHRNFYNVTKRGGVSHSQEEHRRKFP